MREVRFSEEVTRHRRLKTFRILSSTGVAIHISMPGLMGSPANAGNSAEEHRVHASQVDG